MIKTPFFWLRAPWIKAIVDKDRSSQKIGQPANPGVFSAGIHRKRSHIVPLK